MHHRLKKSERWVDFEKRTWREESRARNQDTKLKRQAAKIFLSNVTPGSWLLILDSDLKVKMNDKKPTFAHALFARNRRTPGAPAGKI
jgi:hypothetical protein